MASNLNYEKGHRVLPAIMNAQFVLDYALRDAIVMSTFNVWAISDTYWPSVGFTNVRLLSFTH